MSHLKKKIKKKHECECYGQSSSSSFGSRSDDYQLDGIGDFQRNPDCNSSSSGIFLSHKMVPQDSPSSCSYITADFSHSPNQPLPCNVHYSEIERSHFLVADEDYQYSDYADSSSNAENPYNTFKMQRECYTGYRDKEAFDEGMPSLEPLDEEEYHYNLSTASSSSSSISNNSNKIPAIRREYGKTKCKESANEGMPSFHPRDDEDCQQRYIASSLTQKLNLNEVEESEFLTEDDKNTEPKKQKQKRLQFCRLCASHGEQAEVKGHKWFCKYRNCTCADCESIRACQDYMKKKQRQTRIYQHQNNLTDQESENSKIFRRRSPISADQMNFPQKEEMVLETKDILNCDLFEQVDKICRPPKNH